jgi:hypothetical protein
MQQVQTEIVTLIMNAVRERHITTLSTVHFIAECMKLVETFPNLSGEQKKLLLVEALKDVAKGKDNVKGTSDDIISEKQLNVLEMMLTENIVGEVIELVIDITKHKFTLEKGEKVAKKGCALLWSCCRAVNEKK